jgi:hypothetical protein
MAVLVPCLVQLRREFNQAFPRRDVQSDGWIADALHSPSSHHSPDESSSVLRHHDADSKNEVHALDVDEDLRDAQTTMAEAVREIHRRHRAGIDNRITEIIYEGRIATAARGWTWRDYSGANPHDKHAHFSASYVTSRESDVRPFGVAALAHREDTAAMATQFNADDRTELYNAAKKTTDRSAFPTGGGLRSDVGQGVLEQGMPRDTAPGTTRVPVWYVLAEMHMMLTALTAAVAAVDNRVDVVNEKLDSMLADPDDRVGGGANDPGVRKVWWALANPES